MNIYATTVLWILSHFHFQVRFLADLVNCHVIVAGSLLAMFDNFIEVTLEDNIPQVKFKLSFYRLETPFRVMHKQWRSLSDAAECL